MHRNFPVNLFSETWAKFSRGKKREAIENTGLELHYLKYGS
jgi:hypothetical protein